MMNAIENTDKILTKITILWNKIIGDVTDGKYDMVKLTSIPNFESEEHISSWVERTSNIILFTSIKFDKLVDEGYFLNNKVYKQFATYADTTKYDSISVYFILMILEFLFVKRKYNYEINSGTLSFCNKLWNLFNTNEVIYREDLEKIIKDGLANKVYSI